MGRFLTPCGRTRESCEGGWDSVYAGISLMPCLPGKQHKEGGKGKNEDTEFRALLCFFKLSALPFQQNLIKNILKPRVYWLGETLCK